MEQTIQKIQKIILENYDLIDKIPVSDERAEIEHLKILCVYIAQLVSDTVIRDVYSKITACLGKDNSKCLVCELEQLMAKYADLTK